SAAHAARAEAITRKKRSSEVFMVLRGRRAINVLCDRQAVHVMRARKAVNASIRCAATRHALRGSAEFRPTIRQIAPRTAALEISLHPAAQTAAGPVPSANGTAPRT